MNHPLQQEGHPPRTPQLQPPHDSLQDLAEMTYGVDWVAGLGLVFFGACFIMGCVGFFLSLHG